MIANLKQAFKCLVYESDWMDCVTKSIAYEKVDAMVEFIAYPDWIKNKTALEDYYDGVLFTYFILIFIILYNFFNNRLKFRGRPTLKTFRW